jgi:hypothetical protein
MRRIDARGGFEAVGQAVGEATRDDVRFVVESIPPYLAKHTRLKGREEMLAAVARHRRMTEAYFPEAFVYLRGLARGSGTTLDDLMLALFDENIFEEYGEKCSTLAAPGAKGWIVGHNEDYDPHYRGRLSLLDLSFDGWPRLLAVSYPGKLPGIGGTLNARGLSVTNNSLSAAEMVGVSTEARVFRTALASDLAEAEAGLGGPPSSLIFHLIVVSSAEDKAVSYEIGNAVSSSSPLERRELADGPMAHTNTVLNLPLIVSDGGSTNSLRRYEKLGRAIAAGAPTDPQAMMALLSEHDGLLNRGPADHPTSVTLATVVIRAATGELWLKEYGTADEAVHRHAL